MFKRIRIDKWRQFHHVDIEFHSKLTVLTGANGVGKTTLLNILSGHFGWAGYIVSTPKRSKNGALRYMSGLWKQILSRSDAESEADGDGIIGDIEYMEGEKSSLTVPKNVGQLYALQIPSQVAQKGLHIPSHRPVYRYETVTQIPTSVSKPESYLSSYLCDFMNYDSGNQGRSTNFRIKEALIALTTLGPGNEIIQSDKGAQDLFYGFQNVLRTVLPTTLGFNKISIRIPEVVLETNSGDFSLDSASGGIASIIDLAWQIFMQSHSEKKFTVTIDEPENHLHPSMQRTLLPNFLEAFPNTQFIVSSHSPIIVTCMRDSNVYALNYNSENRVTVEQLDLVDKAGTANEVLREILGVPVTLPVWAESDLQQALQELEKQNLTEVSLKRLREQLKPLGLDRYYPETLQLLIDRREG